MYLDLFRPSNEPKATSTFVPPNDSKINLADFSCLSPVTLWITMCVDL